MIENVNDPRFDEIAEAKKLGHKFIKVYLHPSKIGKGQKEVLIGGAIILRGYRKGDDDFDFIPEKDANMVFIYDRNEREHICWLYDDPGKGYFSDVGYNRDLLATHWTENYFVLKEPSVYAEVKRRYEFLKENPPNRKQRKEQFNPQGRATPETAVKDLEDQIKFLKGRADQIKKTQLEQQKEDEKLEEAYEDLKNDPTKQPPVAEKKKPGRPRSVNREEPVNA